MTAAPPAPAPGNDLRDELRSRVLTLLQVALAAAGTLTFGAGHTARPTAEWGDQLQPGRSSNPVRARGARCQASPSRGADGLAIHQALRQRAAE